jgi:hypothetical protein
MPPLTRRHYVDCAPCTRRISSNREHARFIFLLFVSSAPGLLCPLLCVLRLQVGEIKKDIGKGTIINIKLGSEGPEGPVGPPGPEGPIGPVPTLLTCFETCWHLLLCIRFAISSSARLLLNARHYDEQARLQCVQPI